MRGVHHVVARLVGEGDLGDVHVARRPRRGRPLRVRQAHDGQLRLRDDHAQGDVHVHHVHHAPPQTALGDTFQFVGVLFRVQRLLDRQTVVDESQLHVLARTEVRRAEHHRVVGVHEAAQPTEQLVGMPRHLHALHRQLVVHVPAHAHDGHVGCALPLAEAHGAGLGVQPVHGDARPLRASRRVVVGVAHVVEQRARLQKHAQRAGAHVIAQRGRGRVQVRQQHVGTVEAQAAVQLLQHVAQHGVRRGRSLQLLARAGEPPLGARELHHGVDAHIRQRLDGLPGGGHDAADLLQLVAEEVQPHRVHEVAGEHVDRAAAHGEGAGAVQLAGVPVAALLQRMGKVLELRDARRLGAGHGRQLAAHRKRHRHVHVGARRRQRAHERAGAGHHHDLAAAGQRVHGLHAPCNLRRVAGLRHEGVVAALGKAHDALVAQVGRQAARERHGRVLARHHDERRLRLVREPRRHEERTRRRGHAQRAVLARVQLAPERVEAARFLQGERQ